MSRQLLMLVLLLASDEIKGSVLTFNLKYLLPLTCNECLAKEKMKENEGEREREGKRNGKL